MIRLRHKLFLYVLRIFDQVTLIVCLLWAIDFFGRLQGTGSLEYLIQNYYHANTGVGLAILFFFWAWSFNSLVNYQTNRLTSLKGQILDASKGLLYCRLCPDDNFHFLHIQTNSQ